MFDTAQSTDLLGSVDADQSAHQMGVWRKVDVLWTLNHSEVVPDSRLVRRIRREIHPFFVPLVVEQVWIKPNGAISKHPFYCIAQALPATLRITEASQAAENGEVQAKRYGITRRNKPIRVIRPIGAAYRLDGPVFPCRTLDGYDNDPKVRAQKMRGEPGVFQEFTGDVVASMTEAAWEWRNPEQARKRTEAYAAALEAEGKAEEQEKADKDAWVRREKARYRMAKVFVPAPRISTEKSAVA